MTKTLYVGLHTFEHDGSICTFDTKTLEFKYLKFERLTEKKHQHYNDINSWVKYLKHLGYQPNQVQCVFLVSCGNMLQYADFKKKTHNCNMSFVDHHTSHHWSTNNKNSLVFDNIGSQIDTLTVFKNNQQKFKLNGFKVSIGYALHMLWCEFFAKTAPSQIETIDYAGHTMALHGLGENYSNFVTTQQAGKTLEHFKNFSKHFKDEKTFNIVCNYVCSLHHFWYKEISRILKDYFDKSDKIYFSGGCGHNIVLNTLLKKTFSKFEPTPHCGDEGTSIGALLQGLSNEGVSLKINLNKLHQHDENFGYASDKIIDKAAQFLYEGKLVMWGQGWGELGPRALGYRSILMNPCVENAKEIINDRIKKRVWFRPYGASVPQEDSEQYFELGHDSPWMLYQANVKDKVKFKNITHADGTCRIQTVNKSNFAYYKLLKRFEQLSGFPILINTSMNLPGKPMVGTKKQAVKMFKNSQADVLILGNKIYKK